MRTKAKYYFDHLPKTGGTTVYQMLKTALGEGSATDQIELAYREAMSRYGSKQLISCHTTFTEGDVFDPDRYYLTLLREPLDRALSHYWYRRGFDYDHGWADVIISKKHSFDQMLYSTDPKVLQLVSNVQATHYAGIFIETTSDESELLDAAKRALDCFNLVGLNEDMEDFLLVFGAECGVRIGNNIPKLNVTKNRKSISDLSADAERRFKKLNAVDIELYHYAQTLFRQHRRRVLSMAASHVSEVDVDTDLEADHGVPEFTFKIMPKETGGQKARIEAVIIKGHLSETERLFSGEQATIFIKYSSVVNMQAVRLRVDIHNDAGACIFGTDNILLGRSISLVAGKEYGAELIFRTDLAEGVYFISAELTSIDNTLLHRKSFMTTFHVAYVANNQFYGLLNLNPFLRIVSDGKVEAEDKSNIIVGDLKLGAVTKPLTEFDAGMKAYKDHLYAMPNELLAVEVLVTNQSSQTWSASGSRPVQIGARYLDRQGRLLTTEELRTRLPRDVTPGESMRLFVHVRSFAKPGSYILRICLVQEFVAWFDDYKTGFSDIDITVTN